MLVNMPSLHGNVLRHVASQPTPITRVLYSQVPPPRFAPATDTLTIRGTEAHATNIEAAQGYRGYSSVQVHFRTRTTRSAALQTYSEVGSPN